MIRIECTIMLAGGTRSSVLGFDRLHERDLDAMCRNAGSMVRGEELISARQLAAYCGHYLAESLRLSGGRAHGLPERVRSAGACCRELDGAERVIFGVMVDSLPQRTFSVPLAGRDPGRPRIRQA